MKKFTIILAMILCAESAWARHTPVSILTMTSSIIYLKVHKHYLGATIEILDEQGNTLITEELQNKRVIVDFYYKKAGTYLVKIKKGHTEQQFKFDHLDHPKPNEVATPTGIDSIMEEQKIEDQLVHHEGHEEEDKILIIQKI
jgi:hypothetical protein